MRASTAMSCRLLHEPRRLSEHPLACPVRSHMFAIRHSPAALGNRARRPNTMSSARLVVGVSGASGAAYGLRVLDACRELSVESHLIFSRAAALTLAQETTLGVADVQARADVVHKVGDAGASVASGSFPTPGIII